MKAMKKYIPLMVILVLSACVWFFNLYTYFSFDTLKVHQQFLDDFVAQNKILSVVIYCIIYIAVVGLSIPGAAFMTLAGGFLLGQWIGTMAAVFSATLGASLLFLSAKNASADLLSKKAGAWAQKMQSGFSENAFSYLLTLRLIPIFPFVAINLAAALFQIPLRTFFWGTFLGIMPGSFVYVSMGVALRAVIQMPDFSSHIILDPKIFVAFIGLGLLSLLPILYKYLGQKKSAKTDI